ncbi:MAG TPA: sulfite exporter TauE/SafE family protein [Longimicrobiaceae bacterium]|nr:sulfite exporter TauE/SafE family protein [Longimicrobiaceae bacterium]
MEALGFGLAAVIGLALGMLGGGGSILTVPVLVYVLGFGAKEAIATSLAVVGATSLLGALGHWRAGNVNLRIAGIFGAVAMVGTYLGARLSVFFSGSAQLILFAVVMLAAAYFMFRGLPLRCPEGFDEADEPALKEMPLLLIAAEGIGVGVLTGLVGVGGGFLIVPALVLLGRVPMKQAIGTSLLVIAMKSAAGFYGYLGQVAVDWAFIGWFTAVAIVGILAGAYLVGFVSQVRLQRAFAVFLLAMGTWLLYQNRGVVLTRSVTAAVVSAAAGPAHHAPLNLQIERRAR